MTFEEHLKIYNDKFSLFEILQQYDSFRNAGERMALFSRGIMQFPKDLPFLDFLYNFMSHNFKFHFKKDCEKNGQCHLCLHEISKWIESYEKIYIEAQKSGNQYFPLSGYSIALMRLAFDFLLIDQKLMQQSNGQQDLEFNKTVFSWYEKLLAKDHFQSVRQEIFAASTLIKAGFDLQFFEQDKGPRGQGRQEFNALKNGNTIAVEARSRVRPGAYGVRGAKPTDQEIKSVAKSQIDDAIVKDFGLPTLIFIDLNLPPNGEAGLFDRGVGEQLKLELKDGINAINPQNFNKIIITNNPDLYIEEAVTPPLGETWIIDAPNPKYQIDPSTLNDVRHYARLASSIVTELGQIPAVARKETFLQMIGKA